MTEETTSGPASPKYFTVEEANQTLPLVRAILADIVKLFAEIHERRERLSAIRGSRRQRKTEEETPYSEELNQIETEIQKQIGQLEEYIDELRQLGIELKDPVKGLVDFRTLMDGREVYLCWHPGEEEIGYWHELEAGFAGRQSLLESSLSSDNDGHSGNEDS